MLPLLVAASLAVPNWVPEILERWEPLGVEVSIQVEECGSINGWYGPLTDTIGICTESLAQPELARWIFNHELAHAFMDQHGIPDLHFEFAADELATLMAPEQDSLAAAMWFMSMADQGQRRGDPHPAYLDRAAAVLCLLDGSLADPSSRMCHAYYTSAVDNWLRLIVLSG